MPQPPRALRSAPAFTLGLGLVALTPEAVAAPSVGLNLSETPFYGSELVFADVSKQFLSWYPQKTGQPYGTFDDDGVVFADTGLPTFMAPDHSADSRWDRPIGAPGGTYEVSWEGQGTFEFLFDRRISNLTANGFTVELDESVKDVSQVDFFRISDVVAADPLRNLQVRRAGSSTGTFQQSFLDRWSGMDSFRYMDWSHTNNQTLADWDDRPVPGDAVQGTLRGNALEYQIEHANLTGTNPWFNLPHLATDDYLREAATLIRDNLDDGLVARVEYSNEVWNGAFEQGKHAAERGLEEGYAGDAFTARVRWGANRAVEMFQIFEEVFTEADAETGFAGDADGLDRLIRVMGAQAANTYAGRQALDLDLGEGRRAADYVDALAIAPYFGAYVNPFDGSPGGPDGEGITPSSADRWRATEVLDTDTPEQAEQKFQDRLDLVEDGMKTAFRWMEQQAAFLQLDLPEEERRYGDLQLFAAEAGQSFSAHPSLHGDAVIIEMLAGLNRLDEMEDFYFRYLQKWEEVGGSDILLFSSITDYDKYGSWGLLENEGQSLEDSAKFRGVQRYLASRGVPEPTTALAVLAAAPLLLRRRRP